MKVYGHNRYYTHHQATEDLYTKSPERVISASLFQFASLGVHRTPRSAYSTCHRMVPNTPVDELLDNPAPKNGKDKGFSKRLTNLERENASIWLSMLMGNPAYVHILTAKALK